MNQIRYCPGVAALEDAERKREKENIEFWESACAEFDVLRYERFGKSEEKARRIYESQASAWRQFINSRWVLHTPGSRHTVEQRLAFDEVFIAEQEALGLMGDFIRQKISHLQTQEKEERRWLAEKERQEAKEIAEKQLKKDEAIQRHINKLIDGHEKMLQRIFKAAVASGVFNGK